MYGYTSSSNHEQDILGIPNHTNDEGQGTTLVDLDC